MKEVIVIALILFTVMLSVPLINLSPTPKAAAPAAGSVDDSDLKAPDIQTVSEYESFRIKISETEEIKNIPAAEYIFGVVAAEMPALYDEQALKAQAIAAFTFACRRKAAANGAFDLTDTPETDQCYISNEKLKERWGERFEEYSKKIKSAVDDVSGYILTYDGTAALTVYHAISSGVTESSADVWGKALPYLVPVESVGDKLAGQYLSEKSYTAEQIKAELSALVTPKGEPNTWFKNKKTTKSGRVKSIDVSGKEISGSQIASALSLRSANFDIEYEQDKFNITVRGYGHGVGMSQNGADYMAKQGSSYEEILLHYYPGCELSRVSGKG